MSPIPQPDQDFQTIAGWVVKIGAAFFTFVGGVVSGTIIVLRRVDGFNYRISAIESAQRKCQGETLHNISQQIEVIPDKIEEKMNSNFARVHARIDEILLRGEGNDRRKSDRAEDLR